MTPAVPSSQKPLPLVQSVGKVFIIAHKEPTQSLEQAFQREGFDCEVLRQVPQPEYQTYSRSYLCLLNHRHAWEKASQANQLTLIVEADFVPVRGLGQLPLPCPANLPNLGIAWLYVCAPQVYSVSKDGYADGFSVSTVAYLVSPQSAQCLIELADDIKRTIGPEHYSSWDSTIDQFLRSRQFKNYIPFRNYGEHGGHPNPEHRQRGLSPAHRADVLYGQLAFLPLYAMQNAKHQYIKYFRVRLYARLKGLGRLVLGKFVRIQVLKKSGVPARLLSFTIRRQFSIQP